MKKILLALSLIGMLSINPMFANTPGFGKVSRHHYNRESAYLSTGDFVKINYKNDGRIEKTYRNGHLIQEKRIYNNGVVKTYSK